MSPNQWLFQPEKDPDVHTIRILESHGPPFMYVNFKKNEWKFLGHDDVYMWICPDTLPTAKYGHERLLLAYVSHIPGTSALQINFHKTMEGAVDVMQGWLMEKEEFMRFRVITPIPEGNEEEHDDDDALSEANTPTVAGA
jgi:hypothetical protein